MNLFYSAIFLGKAVDHFRQQSTPSNAFFPQSWLCFLEVILKSKWKRKEEAFAVSHSLHGNSMAELQFSQVPSGPMCSGPCTFRGHTGWAPRLLAAYCLAPLSCFLAFGLTGRG